jgi:hypothetical protein
MTYSFVKDEKELNGKRANCVAGIIEQLIEADGQPVAYAELLESVEMADQPAQMMPAMNALELVGAIERYTYVEPGKKKPRLAFALRGEVEVVQ